MTWKCDDDYQKGPDTVKAIQSIGTVHVNKTSLPPDRANAHSSMPIYDVVTDSITQWGHDIIKKYMII